MNPLALGARKLPTKQHYPAVWECMLGTVYAASPEGEVRYFDYDYAAAMRFAKVRRGRNDLRTYRRTWRNGARGLSSVEGPHMGQLVLYRRRSK